jgi:hypothetical protein
MDATVVLGMLGVKEGVVAVKPPHAVSVHLRAALGDGYTSEASAVIVCLRSDREPYRVLAWTPAVAPLRP